MREERVCLELQRGQVIIDKKEKKTIKNKVVSKSDNEIMVIARADTSRYGI